MVAGCPGLTLGLCGVTLAWQRFTGALCAGLSIDVLGHGWLSPGDAVG